MRDMPSLRARPGKMGSLVPHPVPESRRTGCSSESQGEGGGAFRRLDVLFGVEVPNNRESVLAVATHFLCAPNCPKPGPPELCIGPRAMGGYSPIACRSTALLHHGCLRDERGKANPVGWK